MQTETSIVPLHKKPKKGVYLLPNTLTLCSLLCGFIAILSTINGKYLDAAWFIVLATVFDGLDGWIARLTNTTTRFGLELDSLSDLVAFGVAPAVMIYKWALMPFGRFGWAVAFLFVACGALRLARFNIQTGLSTSKAFKGMPIPGAAIIMCSIVIYFYEFNSALPEKSYFYPAITIIISLLMVSTLRFHGLKEIRFNERKPFWALLVFVLILFILLIHPSTAIFVFAMAYIIWGFVENTYLLIKKHKQPQSLSDQTIQPNMPEKNS